MFDHSHESRALTHRVSELVDLLDAGSQDEAVSCFAELYTHSRANPNLVRLNDLLLHLSERYEFLDSLTLGADSSYAISVSEPEPEIYVVTPSYNCEETIGRTLDSVAMQRGKFSLRYHVQDGGSTDGTLDVLEDYRKKTANTGSDRLNGKHIHFTYSTGSDSGMYDALLKGFQEICPDSISPYSWMTWINADDQLEPFAFSFLRSIDQSSKASKVDWITGLQSVRRENGMRQTFAVPLARELIARGLCDGKYWRHVQQEGTFWRWRLWRSTNAPEKLSAHRYAGDWRLWFEFAQDNELFQAQVPLGIFNFRKGQLSQASAEKYAAEIDQVVSSKKRAENFDYIKRVGVSYADLIYAPTSNDVLLRNRVLYVDREKSEKSGLVEQGHQQIPLAVRSDSYYTRSNGISEARVSKERLGIIVFGHTRDRHIEAVLKSLQAQGVIDVTNVWIDGHQGKKALIDKTENVARVVGQYQVRDFVRHSGQLGFRKMLIHGLTHMVNNYESIIVLEDDCYPTKEAISVFESELKTIALDPSVFSVYGHHFLTPSEDEYVNRFQGWGWATTDDKLKPILHQLIDCFSMRESDFLEFVSKLLTAQVRDRIDVTPPRNPSVCLEHFFAWDETVALLTGVMGLRHKKTSKRVIYNAGMEEGEHFSDKPLFRSAPFNMLTLSEAVSRFAE